MANDVFSEKNEDEVSIDIPKEKRYLNTVAYDYSVDYVYNLIKGADPKVILEVPFQRKYIWDESRSSRFIESLILNVPIPPLYCSEEDSKKWLVIDGLQRLSTIKAFYENEFKLKNMEIIKELNGQKYKDLPVKAASLLDDAQLRVIVIKNDSHPDIKFDIFMRLNKGSVSLNAQELRNCMHRGPLLENLKRSIANHKYLQLLQIKRNDERFLDLELAIRLISIATSIDINAQPKGEETKYFIREYSGSLVSFINTWMGNANKEDVVKIDQITNRFNQTIECIYDKFGANAFVNMWNNSKGANKSVADYVFSAVYYGISQGLDLAKLHPGILEIGNNDEGFRNAVNVRTSHAKALNYRISRAIELFEN